MDVTATPPEHPADIRWVRSDRVLWRRTTFEIVLLDADPTSSGVVSLAGSGAELWDLLAHPHSLSELAEMLAQVHGADNSDVAAGLAPVLGELADLKMVVAEETRK